MKTRDDFVSNSSSCSFVVNDIASFRAKLAELCRDDSRDFLDLWWLNSLSVKFEFDNCEENREKFKSLSSFFDFIYENDNEPPALVSTSMMFDQLLSAKEEDLALMKDIRIEAAMCDSDSLNSLAFLFYAMKSCKIDVDNSSSEQSFSLFNMSIPEKVIEAALAARGEV